MKITTESEMRANARAIDEWGWAWKDAVVTNQPLPKLSLSFPDTRPDEPGRELAESLPSKDTSQESPNES
jgi:hypothetical protein